MSKRRAPKETVLERKGPRKKKVKTLVGGKILETGEYPEDHRYAHRQMLEDARKACQVMPSPGRCKQLHSTETNTTFCPTFPHQE